MSVICVELNEVNFEMVERYVERGELPNFANLLARHGFSRTTSEDRYEKLEPWIQWVTAHTGLSLADHGVFRLGDFPATDHRQIYEHLHEAGVTVGAVSPMNAALRGDGAAFFIPDPWTRTGVKAGPIARGLYKAICQAVNENAQSRLTAASAIRLAAGLARYGWRLDRYAPLVRNILSGKSWYKALLLDRLLADLFIAETRKHRPGFATVFLNAAAHIQHHYLFNSAIYEGPHGNPDWYIDRTEDPLLDVYRLYDRLIGEVSAAFPDARLLIATGLHQDPHDRECLYWRLRRPEVFLASLDIPFTRVDTLMSRDFVVHARDADAALRAQRRLERVVASDGTTLFEVDNRGDSLFCTLTYPDDIADDLRFGADGAWVGPLKPEVAFVAVKNGHHNGIGYWLDTGAHNGETFPLRDIPNRICEMVGAPPLND